MGIQGRFSEKKKKNCIFFVNRISKQNRNLSEVIKLLMKILKNKKKTPRNEWKNRGSYMGLQTVHEQSRAQT